MQYGLHNRVSNPEDAYAMRRRHYMAKRPFPFWERPFVFLASVYLSSPAPLHMTKVIVPFCPFVMLKSFLWHRFCST